MKTRAVILAGGEGSRLSTLTAKRTKPAVPFAGKYRIIDFTLSNCVNSNISDVMILVQYRPHSLIEHIGAGGPWDLNRDFTGGVRIYTPYKARGSSDWYMGTADAVQQNFLFIKQSHPDLVLILSGDHIYSMNYEEMIDFHLRKQADLTIATIKVSLEDASRFGIMECDPENKVTSFWEKPAEPPSDQANMGVYLFNRETLDRVLWEDHMRTDTSHDFGKDVLPLMIESGRKVYAFPYSGYWVDVGTVDSYWQAHMDLLVDPPALDLNNRQWIIHTRTEERPPARIARGASIIDSMISDGCVIANGAHIERSVLSPGVIISPGAIIRESIVFTDASIGDNSRIQHAIIDKRVRLDSNLQIGEIIQSDRSPVITTIGKNSHLPAQLVIEAGAVIGPDVIPTDFMSMLVRSQDYIQTRRLPNEI